MADRLAAVPMQRKTISPDALVAALTLMPMHLIVDSDGHILSVGSTMRRVIGDSADFFEVFEPVGAGALSDLVQAERVFLRVRARQGQALRGRAVATGDGGALFNLGFGIGVVEAIRSYGLTDRDFAPAELVMELMFLHEANNAMTTELSRANLRLEEARVKAEAEAFTDPLTGLYNRRGLELAFGALRQGALSDPPQHFAMIVLDLDRFKQLNDTRGHAAGDAMLREVAARLHAITREEDTVARTGGDEFVLLLPNVTDCERLASLGGRIVDSIERPVSIQGASCRVSTSLGGALSSSFTDLTCAGMQAAADEALYAAKRSGRACIRIAPEQLGGRACKLPRYGLTIPGSGPLPGLTSGRE